MNRNQAFGMNNSLSSNIFNGTGKPTLNSAFIFLSHPSSKVARVAFCYIVFTAILCAR